MLLKDIETSFPFISVTTYGGNEYVGIIVNQDQHVTSMYVYTHLNSDIEKEYRYLVSLNNQLKNLKKQKVIQLSKESALREKIKKNLIQTNSF